MNWITVVVNFIILFCGIGMGWLACSLCVMAGEAERCKNCRVDKMMSDFNTGKKVVTPNIPTIIFEENNGKEENTANVTGQCYYPTM